MKIKFTYSLFKLFLGSFLFGLLYMPTMAQEKSLKEKLKGKNKTSTSSTYNPIAPPNTFQAKDNPYYWKNKKPATDYWQQDVYYKIKANIDETVSIIDAKANLTYWNNSPDTLQYVYFHLYQNAFQPESHYHNLHINNKKDPKFGAYEAQGLGTVINTLEVVQDDEYILVPLTYDNTLVKVTLPSPLLPNTSVEFAIDFQTHFDIGEMRRRMKKFSSWQELQFNGVHWYPRISVYDRKFGWTTDQHLGREFYGDFGTFDVELTFANDYIVEATGALLNRKEMLPDTLREKLDLKNFEKKTWNSPPSTIIKRDATRKTWHFYAENVHDFAFTASPHYRIGEVTRNGVTCIAMVQEPHAAHWQNAAEYAMKCVDIYSTDIGKYGYHKMVVADAKDGMEYPMITLDSGWDPGYRDLFAHEIGHNWFFGMVGTNETYRAFMDEGFTQFLTAWALEKIEGKYAPQAEPAKKYIKKYRKPVTCRHSEAYYGYHRAATQGRDAALNTHSDAFGGALRHGGGYGMVYSKTATMLYNLQYVLGDSLFLQGLQHYFKTWKFAHPYPEDMRQAFTDGTKVDLNWFFDQWLETTKKIDYAIEKVKKAKEPNTYTIELARKGRMQMPIDLSIITKKGDTIDYYIPNQWFEKETTAKTLKKWYGWDKLHPTYTTKVTVEEGIKNVIIDRSERLADINRLDNHWKTPIETNFDSRVWNYPTNTAYTLNWRPKIWYNGVDWGKVGLHWNGNYFNYKHEFAVTTWLASRPFFEKSTKTGLAKVGDFLSIDGRYETSILAPENHTKFHLAARALNGLFRIRTGFKGKLPNGDRWNINIKTMKLYEDDYLLYPKEWGVVEVNRNQLPIYRRFNHWNNSLNVGYSHPYQRFNGQGSLNFNIKTSASFGEYNYNFLNIEHLRQFKGKKLRLATRLFVQIGSGNKNFANITEAPAESMLFLSGANPETMVESKFYRATPLDSDALPTYTEDVMLVQPHLGGGLNIRGYTDLRLNLPNDTYHKMLNGASVNVELAFDRLLFPRQRARVIDWDIYWFADAGIGEKYLEDDFQLTPIFADFGIGTTFKIKRFPLIQVAKPFTLRFDVPFLYSEKILGTDSHFYPRLLIGVGRAF